MLSMLLQVTVTSQIYSSYEAVPRPIEERENAKPQAVIGNTADPNKVMTGASALDLKQQTDAAINEDDYPPFVLDRDHCLWSGTMGGG